MYFKIAIISFLVAACHAGIIPLVDDGHGHAVSSQSIIRHDQNGQDGHFAPIVQHATPIVQHAAPIVQHATPIIAHATPIIQHSIPILQHGPLVQEAPIQHSIFEHSGPIVHATPIVQHVAPAIHHAPIVQHVANVAPVAVAHAQPVEEHAPAKYEFSYSVEDPHTGDHKSQHESRDGDVVKGEYSLLQPDGSIRKVEYTADAHNGFNAIVHNSAPNPQAAHIPAPAPSLAPGHEAFH